MAYPEVIKLEQLRVASAIARELMTKRGSDPQEAAEQALAAVSEISHRLFDEDILQIAEIEEEAEEEFETDEDEDEDDEVGIGFDDVSFAGRSLLDIEAKCIHDTLEHTEGDKTAAADLLGITPQILGRKLKKHKVNV